MPKYLLIESRDPFDSNDVDFLPKLAASLVLEGHEVTLFLVQNAVLSLRHGVSGSALKACMLESLVSTGVPILADDFSLQERGIPADSVTHGVKVASLETVVDALAAGARTLWH
ncbi:DsrE family protein [Burkholderia vietnamiensis]|uniref:DsrE family protein n=1 Tax=Burkholderia vietnamiensis TaxID=60552 RepID=UPI001D14DDEE|nr:DsrE family protein [Burkholderia vietnamiensis]UEC01719.1 DsrE family protein [Burkholderia vietnamiensis]